MISLSLVELDHPFSPSLWHQHSWFLGVWTWTDQDFDICSLDSPALEFGLKQHHQLSWASSSQVEIVGLLSIHNCVSQYFTAAVLLNIYMYSTCSFSLAKILVPKWFYRVRMLRMSFLKLILCYKVSRIDSVI